MRLVRPLDRYVFVEWTKIFFATALGFPLLIVVIDLTDHLQSYLDRNLPRADIALSYVYYMPQSLFLTLPAAVLFATVFSIGTFTRHSEITAAKASGISFYRIFMPILVGALLASMLDLVVAEVVPITDKRRSDLLQESKIGSGSQRYNFVYAGEFGRVYEAQSLDAERGTLEKLQIERKGNGPDYPTVIVSAEGATYQPAAKLWGIRKGEMHVIRDSTSSFTMSFAAMIDSKMTEQPLDMMAKPRNPEEMRYRELTRFIHALERSGGNADKLRVDRALKIAIPITCLVIALFGAPLATSTQRGGTAYGIGVSLATTVTFLMMIQLTKAIGGKALIAPDVAAWLPNMLFAVVALVLMIRVRT
jgi:lipopolysaccharide export system permease protein